MHKYFSNVLNYNELGFKRLHTMFLCVRHIMRKSELNSAKITAGLSEVEKAGELTIQGKHERDWMEGMVLCLICDAYMTSFICQHA